MPSPILPSPRRISRRDIVRASAAVTAGLALSAPAASVGRAQESTSVTLALDWYPNANHAGIYVARDQGYFAEAGLDVEIVVPSDPTTVLQTVGAGRDTFGISYHSEVLFAREQEVPVVSVAALVQHPLNSLMVLEDSPVETPADLAGRSVAVTGLPADEAFLGTMLAEAGLSLDDVELINVGYDLLPSVFSGRADAVIGVYWTHETILAEREGYPVRYLRVEEWGVPDYYELVLVTGESVVNDDEETVRALLGALQQGYEGAIADPGAALDGLIAESPDLVRDVELEGLDLLMPLWTENGTIPFGQQTAARWDAFGDWLKGEGLLGEDVDVAAAWRGDLLPSRGSATPEG
ncbi:MAG: ABC transporter substrate-binding protein [Chloroflexota bacterium]|nr:ABC transporter substrate-binding protein [Chloroflexota bacterium]